MKQHHGVVSFVREVAQDIFEMVLETEMAAQFFVPGQFAHVVVPDAPHLLLRRPISIHSLDKDAGTVTLIVQQKGEGTQRLCACKPGDSLDIMGPLGRGFALPEKGKRVALIGGGVGIAPLRSILEAWPGLEADAFLGYRSENQIYGLSVYEKLCRRVTVSTEDGSFGEKGFVTQPFAAALALQKYDCLYVCGPAPMLRAVAKVALPTGIPCQVSLEERMGCGMGGCRVCTCKTNDSNGGWNYKRVCMDGPVFQLGEVEL